MRKLKELPRSMKESELLPSQHILIWWEQRQTIEICYHLIPRPVDSYLCRGICCWVFWRFEKSFIHFDPRAMATSRLKMLKSKRYVSEFCHRTNYNDCYKIIITALFTLWTRRCSEVPFKMRLIYYFAPSAKKTLNAHRHAHFWNVGFVVAVIKAGKFGTFIEYAARRGQIGSS